ncbi:hypothetical protein ACKI2C_50850, partial [Streptomyces brasiliscabiei]|uniref:hypothetical protein n=1 Tax=Streptomyces brasiliscabiei TaxID=2736302 RepID=UPI0038F610BB
ERKGRRADRGEDLLRTDRSARSAGFAARRGGAARPARLRERWTRIAAGCCTRSTMTLTELRYLVNLDKERHFSRAAERSFVSQP